eukprot:Pgem_evm1s17490
MDSPSQNRKQKLQGLGDCFSLSDPNEKDNPIVYCSDGFVKLTGYTYDVVINQNCRFLQKKEFNDLNSIER